MSGNVNETDPKVLSAFNELKQAEASLDQAKANYDAKLRNLRSAANRSTFCFDGRYYQIRERKDQIYFCVLDGKPQGRKRKDVDPAVEAAVAVARNGAAEIEA